MQFGTERYALICSVCLKRFVCRLLWSLPILSAVSQSGARRGAIIAFHSRVTVVDGVRPSVH